MYEGSLSAILCTEYAAELLLIGRMGIKQGNELK